MYHLSIENYALFGALQRTTGQESSLSESSEELFQRGKGRVRIYSSFAEKQNNRKQENMQLDIQRLPRNVKKRTSHVHHFSAFLCMGRCTILGMLKLFFRYASQVSRASIQPRMLPVFLHPEFPSGCTFGGCTWPDALMALDMHCLLTWRATIFLSTVHYLSLQTFLEYSAVF